MEKPRVLPTLACVFLLTVFASLGLFAEASAQPDWEASRDVQVVSILTRSTSGDLRKTKIWLVVLDGQAFIRSGNAIRGGGESWVDDLARDPHVILRIEGTDFPVNVVPVEDSLLVERVQLAYREKYGLIDRFIRWVRPSLTTISRLDPIPES